MKVFYLGIIILQLGLPLFGVEPVVEQVDDQAGVFPSELKTKKGLVYQDCKLKRIEPDAVIIEHKEGVAKVSFFDLDEKLQSQHGFDPVVAIEKYKNDQAIQRELKWQRFWEGQKHQATVAEQEDYARFLKEVKTNWVPVEAQVRKISENGAFVKASRITFVPTKTKSTLGFEIDGPLRKTLVPMEPEVIFIKTTGKGDLPSTGFWTGYLSPLPDGTALYPVFGLPPDEVPSYRAVARSEIK